MPMFENGKDFGVHNSTLVDVGRDSHIYYGTKQNPFSVLESQVAPGAFHNSGERFDPPKCHEGTRVAVLKTIWEWFKNKEVGAPRIMWLYGPAGAGKSAIAQTLAEEFHNLGILAASFFFSRRAASGRNDATRLVATIAYQIAQYIPDTRFYIQQALENDPMIFSKSLETQLHELVTKPLLGVVPYLSVSAKPWPELIIIDGLDECSDGKVQSSIVQCIFSALTRHSLPLRILVASRPELHIRGSFAHPDRRGNYLSLVLDDDFQADSDIELFLRENFAVIRETHILKSHIPKTWPSDEDIKVLVQKSSGQFIFASTVMRYTKSPHHRPMERLTNILGIGSRQDAAPFAELDALYMHILRSVHETQHASILHILGFLLCSQPLDGMKLAEVENFLNLHPGDLYLALADCHSIINIPSSAEEESDSRPSMHFHHASISDFLIDPSRSQRFFIDQETIHAELTRACLKGIRSPHLGIRLYSSDYLPYHSEKAHMDKALFEELLSLNLSDLFKIYTCDVEQSPHWSQYSACINQIDWIQKQAHQELFDIPEGLVSRHLATLDCYLKDQLNAFTWPDRVAEVFAMADEIISSSGFPGLPYGFRGVLDVWGHVGNLLHLDIRGACESVPDQCKFLLAASFVSWKTQAVEQVFMDFFYDKERSGDNHINQNTYAHIALHCVKYVCGEPHENINYNDRSETSHNPGTCQIGLVILPSILSSAAPLQELADILQSSESVHGIELGEARREYLQRYNKWVEQDQPVQSEQDLIVTKRPQRPPRERYYGKPDIIRRRMLEETEGKIISLRRRRQFPIRIQRPPHSK